MNIQDDVNSLDIAYIREGNIGAYNKWAPSLIENLPGENKDFTEIMTAESRYQSRLFNLILQQSRELTEQWQRNLRQAKVTSLWGMQMGLYPIYLLFQVSRFTQQALRQGDVQGQRLLKAVTDPSQDSLASNADGPIRNVLAAIQIDTLESELDEDAEDDAWAEEPQFSVQIEGLSHRRPTIRVRYQKWIQRWAERNPLHNKATRWLGITSEPEVKIQGLACDLQSTHVSLVTPDNEAIDVLTPAQQRELHKLMTWELANYRRQERLSKDFQHLVKTDFRQLPMPKTRSQMLPPVRAFRKAMAWMQTGPMAAKANLFQEALALPGDEASYPLPLALPQGLAATLDQLTPKLTQDAIEMLDGAIASWETTSWEVMGPTATDLSDYVVQHWKQQQSQLQPSLSILSQDPTLGGQPPEHPVRYAATWIPSTLRSAMAALLGRPQPTQGQPAAQAPQQSAPSPNEAFSTLSWADLYSEKIPTASPANTTASIPGSPILATEVSQQLETTASPATIYTQDGSIEIEVDAVMVGYEKHPLERILAGLDRITAWLESALGWAWKRLQPSIQSYFQKVLTRLDGRNSI